MDLTAWMAKSKTPAAELARRCGVHPVTVYKWKAGSIFPRPPQLQALVEATGGAVTANDFAELKNSQTRGGRPEVSRGLAETQAPFITEARSLGLDAAAIAAKAVKEAISAEKGRRWLEENREAIEAHNRWVEEHGLPLAEYRMF